MSTRRCWETAGRVIDGEVLRDLACGPFTVAHPSARSHRRVGSATAFSASSMALHLLHISSKSASVSNTLHR